MLGLMLTLPLLFAQAPAASTTPTAAAPGAAAPSAPAAAVATPVAPTPATPPPANPSSTLIVLPAIILLFYLLVLRPQNTQEKKRKEMINNVGKNSRVVTTGGIYGTVVSVDAESDTVFLRIGDPGMKVEFSRSSILRVLETTEKAKA